MITWWATLTGLEHMLLYIALPATLLLIIQTILLFLGGVSGEDGDMHLDLNGGDSTNTGGDAHDGVFHDEGPHAGDCHDGQASTGLHIFTMRGMVSFFSLFGWGGLWLTQLGLHPFWALFLAIQLGVIGMVGIALLLREALRLQYDGTMDLRNAIGLTGEVYFTIPAGRTASGKVNVLVQDQLQEFDAITDDAAIPTGTEVKVTGLVDGNTLLVSPKGII